MSYHLDILNKYIEEKKKELGVNFLTLLDMNICREKAKEENIRKYYELHPIDESTRRKVFNE